MKWLVGLFAALGLVWAGMSGHLGYFGSQTIVDFPATAPAPPGRPKLVAVLLSGDMGLNLGMGPKIAHGLNQHGIPVIGVNSMIWFRERRTPEDIAAMVNAVTHHALASTHADRVILIGQSFGADALGVGLSGLVPDLRPRVLLVGLIVPTNTVFYRASPAELLELIEPDAPALPTARKLDWVPTICIHGIEEEHSLCPLLTNPNVVRVPLPGGHKVNRDAGRVVAVLSNAIAQALAASHLSPAFGAKS